MRVILFVLALIGTVCSAVQAGSPPWADGRWDIVTFEMNSWGKPVGSWMVTADGSGSWTESQQGASFNDYTLIVHEMTADKAHYDALAAILKRLPIPAPVIEGCKTFMTDAPYGRIRIARGATTIELYYNAGCNDPPYAAYLDVLKAADSLVAEWGKTGRVLRTESHGPSSEGQTR